MKCKYEHKSMPFGQASAIAAANRAAMSDDKTEIAAALKELNTMRWVLDEIINHMSCAPKYGFVYLRLSDVLEGVVAVEEFLTKELIV